MHVYVWGYGKSTEINVNIDIKQLKRFDHKKCLRDKTCARYIIL